MLVCDGTPLKHKNCLLYCSKSYTFYLADHKLQHIRKSVDLTKIQMYIKLVWGLFFETKAHAFKTLYTFYILYLFQMNYGSFNSVVRNLCHLPVRTKLAPEDWWVPGCDSSGTLLRSSRHLFVTEESECMCSHHATSQLLSHFEVKSEYLSNNFLNMYIFW